VTEHRTWTYPPADRDEVVDELHGVTVADPYRYLEDPDGDRTARFVAAQNALSGPYLASLPSRARFGELTTALVTAPRAGVPWERGGQYFQISNPGGRDQDILYTAGSLAELLESPRVLLDPNALSDDGTVALTAASVSDDGSLLAYATSEAGSDWQTIRVRDVASGTDTGDVLPWCKWAAPTWLPDGESFLYWRYPEPAGDTSAALTDAMGVGSLVRHRLGTAKDADEAIWYHPERPEWMVDAWVSADGAYLVLTAGPGTDSRMTVTARRLGRDADGHTVVDADDITVVGELADAHRPVGAMGDRLLLRTERHAPRGALVSVDLAAPGAPWRDVVGQHETDVLVSAHLASGALVLVWSRDAAHHLEVRRLDGTPWAASYVDGPMAVTEVHARTESAEVFAGTEAFTRPVRAHRIDLSGHTPVLTDLPASGEVRLPAVTADRRRARSADGTAVPMTVISRSDIALAPGSGTAGTAGPRPTLLYGYGGFDIPVLPEFRAIFAAWVAAGGVLAVANLRGGGEFGAEWHHGGMLANKQNVFDDAIACAEVLIADGTTTAPQLAVHGRSNGGLLVGALMTQRPDLFGAALPTVGVLDMLRFHRFTIGWAWISDYGDPDDEADFGVLQAYSPLHALREGVTYPPTLICTGDHDDRVVPAHSLKFGAELQRCQAPDGGPVLLRIDTRAGHGAGKPAHAQAAEFADQLAFAAEHTGLQPVGPERDHSG